MVDFTRPSTSVHGTYARRLDISGVSLLWAGNADTNGNLIANGPGQDTSVLLTEVLLDGFNSGLNTNYILSGYLNSDLTMDGNSIFTGPGNDPNLLLMNVLMHPNNTTFSANFIVSEQLP